MSVEFKIPLGLTCEKTFKVDRKYSAREVGSGDVDVLSTPSLIAFMENTAFECVKKFLPKDYTTVGVEVNIKHVKPVPMNSKVTVRASVALVNGRKIVFKVVAYLDSVEVAEGYHTRYIVDLERFLEKARKMSSNI